MEKPPITLIYPTYVIEYAEIDDSIEYMNRRNLNVNGEWLGAVPRLAICEDIDSGDFFLAHCGENWELLCGVESHNSIEESKQNAEKHYRGVHKMWKKTGYTIEDVKKIFEKEREEMKCSFCGKSHFDGEFTKLIGGKNAKICDKCILAFSKEIDTKGS